MFNLKEAYEIIGAWQANEVWDGKIACAFTDGERTKLTNKMTDSLNAYTFTLITQGKLVLDNGLGRQIFSRDEIYTYYPGSMVRILDVSDDYRGICLMVDEKMAHSAHAFRNLLRASMIPISLFGNNKLSLTSDDAIRVQSVLRLISEYISRPLSLKNEILEMLYSVFIDDLISIVAFEKARLSISRQAEEIFISFYELLQRNFIEKHNIGFYADAMSITTTYLSRIVKSITGRTVVDCIDEMLAIEATWLIKSTNLTVAQIADRLNFSTSAAFDKFYKRMRGVTPLSVRTS